MALALGGRRAEAERAYEWLRRPPAADGAWHQYYLADRVEQDKLDANVCAYVAAGVWHHCLLTGDDGFVETMWPVVERGHRLRARPADAAGRDPLGPPRRRHAVVVRPAHRLVVDLPLACAAPSPSPSTSATSAPTGSCRPARLAHVIAPRARRLRAQAPLGDGLVLPGARRRASRGDDGRERLGGRGSTRSSIDGHGVRCVSDRPWITAAETCECALAHLAVGERRHAPTSCSAGRSSYRARRRPLLDRHRVPRRGPLPRRRAVDLHRGVGRARRRRPRRRRRRRRALFVDHDAVLPVLMSEADLDPDHDPAQGTAAGALGRQPSTRRR